jgi:hypothetical protein
MTRPWESLMKRKRKKKKKRRRRLPPRLPARSTQRLPRCRAAALAAVPSALLSLWPRMYAGCGLQLEEQGHVAEAARKLWSSIACRHATSLQVCGKRGHKAGFVGSVYMASDCTRLQMRICTRSAAYDGESLCSLFTGLPQQALLSVQTAGAHNNDLPFQNNAKPRGCRRGRRRTSRRWSGTVSACAGAYWEVSHASLHSTACCTCCRFAAVACLPVPHRLRARLMPQPPANHSQSLRESELPGDCEKPGGRSPLGRGSNFTRNPCLSPRNVTPVQVDAAILKLLPRRCARSTRAVATRLLLLRPPTLLALACRRMRTTLVVPAYFSCS